jgi:hypothetical protein
MLAIFRSSLSETVSDPHEITETPHPNSSSEKVLAWNGWSLNTRSWVLSSQAGTWPLSEVVYYLGPESTAVYHVVLIFGDGTSSVAVRVDSATFLAKFAGAAVAENVIQATVPGSMKNMDAPSPQVVSATAAMAAQFPAVEVGFDTVVHGSRANTGIAPNVAHIVASYGGPRTMYFGHYQTPKAYTDLTYGGKRVWSAESLAAATLKLVVGAVLYSYGLNEGYSTLLPGRELELTRATPTDCFAKEGLSLCPVTGKLLNGASEYDLVEILYVPFDGQWACILNFRPVGRPQNVSFALQLGPEATEMLMTVAKMRVDVLTSTAIQGLATSLPPWPNAHSQGTTNAPVVSSNDHPSLMPVTRARMIWAPGSAVVRYEPVPTCAQYAGNRTEPTGWAMWPLCAADAAARAHSPACSVFKECAPSPPGASTTSLVDARDPKDKELVVPLYESKETGVFYGLTPIAVYVVRPLALSADVVVATETRTERFRATKDARGFRIVAVSPQCAELAKCMKGTELSECYLWAQDCADTEDRSPIAARLEYKGALVELRALDAEVKYGIDSRGAFALHARTGSVIFAPGIKAPAWPREPRKVQALSPLVLAASYDAGTWRVDSNAPTPIDTAEPKSESRTGLWIFITVAVAVAVAVVVGISIARAQGRRAS